MDENIRTAHERLTAAFEKLGYTLKPTTGVIEGVRVWDHLNRYLFAWHKRQHHLLFYVRLPALRATPALRQQAHGAANAGSARENPKGETTITLRSDMEAVAMLDWLLPALPLLPT